MSGDIRIPGMSAIFALGAAGTGGVMPGMSAIPAPAAGGDADIVMPGIAAFSWSAAGAGAAAAIPGMADIAVVVMRWGRLEVGTRFFACAALADDVEAWGFAAGIGIDMPGMDMSPILCAVAGAANASEIRLRRASRFTRMRLRAAAR